MSATPTPLSLDRERLELWLASWIKGPGTTPELSAAVRPLVDCIEWMVTREKAPSEPQPSGVPAQPGSVAPASVHQQVEASVAAEIAAQKWPKAAHNALIEAQVMCESIFALTALLIENSDSDSFPLLEAIDACAQRAHAAINPVIDDGHAIVKEASHG